jgi:nitrite reductase/ring-hydroxylating ferredoxin subunit
MTVTVEVPRDDLRPGVPVRVEVDTRAVLVVLVDGEVTAYEDGCRHRGTSLVDGPVRDCVVTCPGHFWRYDLRTGARADASGEPLPRFPVRLDGPLVLVDLPDLPPVVSVRESLLAAARAARSDPSSTTNAPGGHA